MTGQEIKPLGGFSIGRCLESLIQIVRRDGLVVHGDFDPQVFWIVTGRHDDFVHKIVFSREAGSLILIIGIDFDFLTLVLSELRVGGRIASFLIT